MIPLVKITPVEYDRRRKRIVRYYGYKFDDLLSAELLTIIMKQENLKAFPKIWEESNAVFYQYPKKTYYSDKRWRILYNRRNVEKKKILKKTN